MMMQNFDPTLVSRHLLPLSVTDQSANFTNGQRTASVLLPLIALDSGWHILYTKRKETLLHHRGQISFPGGMAEASDSSAMQTALRETEEELGVPSDTVHLLGRMQEFITIHNMVIHPFVGILHWPQELHVSKDEVSKIIIMPVNWLVDPAHYVIREYNGHPDVVFYKPFDGEILWGITARITKDFMDISIQ